MIDINELRQSLGAVQPEEVEELLDRLEAAEKERDALQAKVDAMERQEPASWIGLGPRDGRIEFSTHRPAPSVMRDFNVKPLYLAPGAQPAPSFADAYQGARECVAIWKKRALEAEDLNRKFVAEINGHAYMGEPAQPAPSLPDTHNDMVVGLDYQGAMSCARQRAKKEAGLLYPEGDARKEEKERELASEYYRQYTTPNPGAKP